MATPLLIVGGFLVFLTFVASVIVLIIVASDKLDIDFFDDILETPADRWTICAAPTWAPWDQVDAFGMASGISFKIADALCTEANLDCTYMVADSANFDRGIVDNVPSDLLTSGMCDAMASWRARKGWAEVVEYTDLAKEGGDWLYMLDTTLAEVVAGNIAIADLSFGGIAGWTVDCGCLGRNGLGENTCTDFGGAEKERDLFQAIADGTIDASIYYSSSTQAALRADIETTSNVTFAELSPVEYSSITGVPVFCAASGLGFIIPLSNGDLVEALNDAKDQLLVRDPTALTTICEAEGITTCFGTDGA